jgi:dihydroorotase
LVHGELIDETIDIFDRERLFIDRVLVPLLDRFRSLRVVFEHITTREAVQFVMSGPDSLAATITPHHLLLNRNALFEGGLQPHHYCHPMPKRENDRQALVEAATSGNPKLFLGTDSAPHPRSAKEGASACAGIYSANSALELYAEVFDEAGAIDRLEEFACVFGAAFYRLPRNTDRVTLRKDAWTVPQSLPLGDDVLVPFRAGHQCAWKLVEA